MTDYDGFSIFKNRLELEGTLTTITALRIGSGRSLEPIGTDLPVIKDAFNRPLIPGSSFKGALRSRLESFLRGVLGDDRKLVANPAVEKEWSLTADEIKQLKGMTFDELAIWLWTKEHTDLPSFKERYELIALKRKREQNSSYTPSEQETPLLPIVNRLPTGEALKALKESYVSIDAALTKAIFQETDLISSAFGSPWQSSKFQVRDLTVNPNIWFGQYQERDGVSIDRDTETAADGRLYDFQVVPAGTEFRFKAVFENAETLPNGQFEHWELGLLVLGLQQFKNQQIPLGGGNSRGLGVVELEIEKVVWVDPEGDAGRLRDYMRSLCQNDLSAYTLIDKKEETDTGQFEELKRDWSEALINYLSMLAGLAPAESTTESVEA